MAKDTASQFILDNFELEDRLAVVLIDRRSGVVTQRIASANQIASQEFQVWLKSENRSGRDVFVSMYDPFTGGMLCAIEMDDLPAIMADQK